MSLRYCFELSPVNLGVDEDGELINSCVIKSIDITTAAIAQLKITGKWDKNIVKAFKQLVNDDGMALESAVIDCAVNMEALVNNGKRDQRKASASRALKKLIEEEFYHVDNGYILTLDGARSITTEMQNDNQN